VVGIERLMSRLRIPVPAFQGTSYSRFSSLRREFCAGEVSRRGPPCQTHNQDLHYRSTATCTKVQYPLT
jgi:hypothetical protein